MLLLSHYINAGDGPDIRLWCSTGFRIHSNNRILNLMTGRMSDVLWPISWPDSFTSEMNKAL